MLTWSGKFLSRPLFPRPPHQNGATVSPTHALFIPSHLNMKCLLLFPLSTHVAYVVPASFPVNGVCIPHLLDYWSHSHTGASVEKEARSSDKECLIGLWWCLFFLLKVSACCSTNQTCSLERVVLKRGQSCWSTCCTHCPEEHKRNAVCKLSCSSKWQNREMQT